MPNEQTDIVKTLPGTRKIDLRGFKLSSSGAEESCLLDETFHRCGLLRNETPVTVIERGRSDSFDVTWTYVQAQRLFAEIAGDLFPGRERQEDALLRLMADLPELETRFDPMLNRGFALVALVRRQPVINESGKTFSVSFAEKFPASICRKLDLPGFVQHQKPSELLIFDGTEFYFIPFTREGSLSATGGGEVYARR